jgi:hypothetical protein
MQGTENLNIGSNNEIEGNVISEVRHRLPHTLKEMSAQSRLRMSGYDLATFEDIPGPKIIARDQLEQLEASERFLSGQSIKELEEPNTTRIFHGIYFTTAPLVH